MKQDAVGQTFEALVRSARLDRGAAVVFTSICEFVEGNFVEAFLAEAHQDGVASDAIEPSRKSGVALKIAEAAKDREESFLSQIFGKRGIPNHAKTEGIDTVTVQAIETFKRGGIALASEFQGLGFRQCRGLRLH